MRAITMESFGGPDVMALTELPDPVAGEGEVVIEVAATAVNRADTLQRQGYYPPPPGVTDVMGLECAGTIVEVGQAVERWQVGDRVCALLAGGGYASRVAVPWQQVMPVPSNLDLPAVAALPEVSATVWSNVWMTARLQPGETLLVHGGAGGIGSFAIQLATALGHRVITTVGSDEKANTARGLGADLAINYRTEDFVAATKEATDGRGVDVILDNMAGSYLARNLSTLATGGRLAIIGMQGGTRAELDMGKLLVKRAAVMATSLRPRPVAEKGAICREVEDSIWPLVESGQILPVIDQVMPLSEVAQAHQRLEASEHTGKIVLIP
ncbi:MAG: NAD(P)H-quinone oxidoreductase [Nocardioides sp.]|jgi:putative PIG3 family NAD(P)H quinone oxidoreductase